MCHLLLLQCTLYNIIVQHLNFLVVLVRTVNIKTTSVFFFLGLYVIILFFSMFLQLVFHVPTSKNKAWERGYQIKVLPIFHLIRYYLFTGSIIISQIHGPKHVSCMNDIGLQYLTPLVSGRFCFSIPYSQFSFGIYYNS